MKSIPTESAFPGAESRSRFVEEQDLTPGGSMRQAAWFEPSPPYAAAGSGCWITDLDGRRYLDCGNNFFSLVHGHAFGPVIKALHHVMERGTAFGLPTNYELDLAKHIKARAPNIEHIRFCNSGSEAVMFAIKAARAVTGRDKIAKFEGAYHGSYDYAEVSLATSPADWRDVRPISKRYSAGTPQSVSSEVIVLPWNDAETCRALLKEHGLELAAILIDPLPTRVAMVPPEQEFIDAISAGTRAAGCLVIADEVVSFRLSEGGASPIFGIEPDLVALGKAIGGGLPVGAIGGRQSFMSVFDHVNDVPAVAQGGTFSGNPLTMAAGHACLLNLDKRAILQINSLGDMVRNELNRYFRKNEIEAQITGYGSLFRLHATSAKIRNYRDSYPSGDRSAKIKNIHKKMASNGILLTPNCSGALSTAMSETEITELINTLGRVTRETVR